ncbi:uncharacterized protein BDZ99DRAFT_567200 [Mytilinidion resinicola]|uniref:Heterokaryon incompatibility domain-containing protein n=1 Tax=Mytilinidion resinicola TaxID=574789 RepID=A0A6A6Z577_9PEZI|nr:uncharacterized protein BDZ99DRAFT_567200 [Mytilinidion resinicola]KAF2815335.1 hypothetical protein BDZ99DRAFT_567200 [Mytilinidion resinicola]
MKDLLSRDWCQRAWTFQELALAYTLVILCGDAAVDWDAFIRGLDAFYPKTERYGRLGADEETLDYWLDWVRRHFKEGLAKREPQDFQIKYAFITYIGGTSLVLVFAGLGLFDLSRDNGFVPIHVLGATTPSTLKLDSKETPLYGALYALRNRVAPNPKDRSYALYVPDWTTVLDETWVDDKYLYNTNEHSATPRLQAHVFIQDYELSVKGTFFGAVSLSSKPLESIEQHDLDTDTSSLKSSRFIGQVLEICRWISVLRKEIPLVDAYGPVSKAVFPVLEGRMTNLRDPNTLHFNSMYRLFVGHNPKVLDGEPEAVEHLLEAFSRNSDAFAYMISCFRKFGGRRNLLVLSNGYIGSGPPFTKVVLIAGVPVPMVVRRQDDGTGRYVLIGPAFVPGVMEGEHWGRGEPEEMVLV